MAFLGTTASKFPSFTLDIGTGGMPPFGASSKVGSAGVLEADCELFIDAVAGA